MACHLRPCARAGCVRGPARAPAARLWLKEDTLEATGRQGCAKNFHMQISARNCGRLLSEMGAHLLHVSTQGSDGTGAFWLVCQKCDT